MLAQIKRREIAILRAEVDVPQHGVCVFVECATGAKGTV